MNAILFRIRVPMTPEKMDHGYRPRVSENHERRMFLPLSNRVANKPVLHLSCLSFKYFFSVMPRSRFSSTPVTRAMNSRSAARLHPHHLTQPRGSEHHERRMFRPLSIRVTYKPVLHLSCLSFIFFFSDAKIAIFEHSGDSSDEQPKRGKVLPSYIFDLT